ncbi:MAG: hypothetical protein ACLQHK_00325 [Gallionellaceae bacterium]
MQTLNINHELIRWPLERSGRSVERLARQFPRLGMWESGEAQATLKQLEALAKKTRTPLGDFFLPEPPQENLPIPDFRTVSDQAVGSASPNLTDGFSKSRAGNFRGESCEIWRSLLMATVRALRTTGFAELPRNSRRYSARWRTIAALASKVAQQ